MTNSEGIPRRTVKELIAKYKLEPDIQDLYVEGVRDRNIYNWYLKSTGRSDVTLVEIQLVEISKECLESHGLDGGNRNRVIALSLELDGCFPKTLSYVRCIADSDFDYVLKSGRTSLHLIYTDYTSVDLYAYDRNLFVKLLMLGFNCPQGEIVPLLASMAVVLRDLFAMRAANEALKWKMTMVPFTRHCKVNGPDIVLDREAHMASQLTSASRMTQREEFEATCKQILAVHVDDPRKAIHGEDFLELLGWYLRRRFSWSGYSRGKRSAIVTLWPSLEYSMLAKETLFLQLEQIYAHNETLLRW